jgi:hypothetical protein
MYKPRGEASWRAIPAPVSFHRIGLASMESYPVVSCEAVDTRLHQNQTELAVAILSVQFQMLAHGHGLLDEVVQVLWQIGGQTLLK